VAAAVGEEPGAAVEIRRAALGHDAGLAGAARLAAAARH
jgi:phage I-like protein